MLLCSPSLQVFGAWIGCRLRSGQTLALALVVAAVAALFSLGFAPILWFLDVTMRDGDWIDAADVARLLLGCSLLAGLVQLLQSVLARPQVLRSRGGAWLLLGWELLVLGVTWRMARVLGLLG